MKSLTKILTPSTVSISYLGKISDKITIGLIDLAESYMMKIEGRVTKKVPYLIAESFQNIIKHRNTSSKKSKKKGEKDFFQIQFLDNKVIISSVNSIENKYVKDLSNKIDKINTHTKEELDSLWRETITDGKISEKGGAGLGIIEMARKSGMPIQKKFVKIDEDTSLFFLGIGILKKGSTSKSLLNIDKVEATYRQCIEDNLLLQYNGQFDSESIVPIIEILETNLIDSDNINSNKVENVTTIIEILQNASKHGMELENHTKEGVFILYEGENGLSICCGNYLNKKVYKNFSKELLRITNMSKEELISLRNKSMLEVALSDNGDGGLGIIELAIATDNQFEYSFDDVGNNNYFFSIEINLKK